VESFTPASVFGSLGNKLPAKLNNFNVKETNKIKHVDYIS